MAIAGESHLAISSSRGIGSVRLPRFKGKQPDGVVQGCGKGFIIQLIGRNTYKIQSFPHINETTPSENRIGKLASEDRTEEGSFYCSSRS